MKGPALKQLLLALSETKDSDSFSLSPVSSAELKPQQMVTILRRLWGDDIHVINPALSLQASPLAKGSRKRRDRFSICRRCDLGRR